MNNWKIGMVTHGAWTLLIFLVGTPFLGARADAAEQKPKPLVVVGDPESSIHRAAAEALGRKWSVHWVRDISTNQSDFVATLPTHTPWLALGPKAATRLIKGDHPNRASALLSRSQSLPGIPTVVLEPTPTELIDWLTPLFPRRRTLVVLASPGFDDGLLRRVAAERGWQLHIAQAKSGSEAVAALRTALGRYPSSVVWIAPDPVTVTKQNIVHLTQAALNARTPAVGFSPLFLRFGAAAAVRPNYGAMAIHGANLAAKGEASAQPGLGKEGFGLRTLVVDGQLFRRMGWQIPSELPEDVVVKR